MARVEKVPDIVVGRLPVYLRALDRLTSEGQEVISSQDLARLLGVSSAQIRKDLSHFGEFGKQGTGYRIAYLQEQLSAILKVDREWEVALVGSGPLAEALVLENPLAGKGCRVTAVFDTRPERIGMRLGELEIQDARMLPALVSERGMKMAILALPAADAQETVDALAKAGIQAILSYTATALQVPRGVRLQYIDPAADLQRMAYYL